MKEIREEKGYTLRELAEKMGYENHSYIHQIEKGKRLASDSFISKFCNVLDLSEQEEKQLKRIQEGEKLRRIYDKIENSKMTSAEKEVNKEIKAGYRLLTAAYTGRLSHDDLQLLLNDLKKLRERHGF